MIRRSSNIAGEAGCWFIAVINRKLFFRKFLQLELALVILSIPIALYVLYLVLYRKRFIYLDILDGRLC